MADVSQHSNILMPDSSNSNHAVATHYSTALRVPYLNSFQRHATPYHQSLRIDFTPQKSAHDRTHFIWHFAAEHIKQPLLFFLAPFYNSTYSGSRRSSSFFYSKVYSYYLIPVYLGQAVLWPWLSGHPSQFCFGNSDKETWLQLSDSL